MFGTLEDIYESKFLFMKLKSFEFFKHYVKEFFLYFFENPLNYSNYLRLI